MVDESRVKTVLPGVILDGWGRCKGPANCQAPQLLWEPIACQDGIFAVVSCEEAAHPDTIPDVIHGLAERPLKSRRSKTVDNSAALGAPPVDTMPVNEHVAVRRVFGVVFELVGAPVPLVLPPRTGGNLRPAAGDLKTKARRATLAKKVPRSVPRLRGSEGRCRAVAAGLQSPPTARFVGLEDAGGVRGVAARRWSTGVGVFRGARLRAARRSTPRTLGRPLFLLVQKIGEAEWTRRTARHRRSDSETAWASSRTRPRRPLRAQSPRRALRPAGSPLPGGGRRWRPWAS